MAEVEAAPAPIRLAGAVGGGQWLAARSELHPAEASALAVLARDLPAMPVTGQALETGRIGTGTRPGALGGRRWGGRLRLAVLDY